MQKRIQKLFFISLFLLFSIVSTHAFTQDDIRCFTLENGLTVFLITDTASAPVRIELDIDAGYNHQTETTAGFFPLYAKLIGADCSVDTVRIVKTVAPEGTEDALSQLALCLNPLVISNSALSASLEDMKTAVTEYAESTEGFINTAIDARIFSSSPWKQESGVYPSLFSRTTSSEARTVLSSIGRQFYTPSNSTLYISGNISGESALALIEKTFGSKADSGALSSDLSAASSSHSAATVPGTTQAAGTRSAVKKYVLVDPEFSPDLTQIVVQYTNLSADDADTLASIFSDDTSVLKQKLTSQKSLAIRGSEYINAASSSQRASSRLIIQSLLEPSKATPAAQAELFVKTISTGLAPDAKGECAFISQDAVSYAHAQYSADFLRRADSSSSLMEVLSSWHTLTQSTDASSLFERAAALEQQSSSSLTESLNNTAPYVFVLVNKKIFESNQKLFSKAGYETITVSNGSWYTDALHKQIVKNEKAKDKSEKISAPSDSDISGSGARFISSNKAAFGSLSLVNGIPVVLKSNADAKTAAIAISIKGGELLSAQTNPGQTSVLADALARNIRYQIALRGQSGVLTGSVSVSADTTSTSSVIMIVCSAQDTAVCVEAAGAALIYGDITPAMADELSYGERTSWRIKTGSVSFQLLCAAIRTMYANVKNDDQQTTANTLLRALYNDSSEILTKSDFTEINASYPMLLDASRYSLVLTGGIPAADDVLASLNRTFGVLAAHQKQGSEENNNVYPAPSFKPAKKRIALRHLFFTDVSADKAGPRPLVLVPTKNFADPVLYILPVPDSDSDKAIFSALLFELEDRLNKACSMQKGAGTSSGKMSVKATAPTADFPFAQILVTNVSKTAAVDSLYASCAEKLIRDIAPLTTASSKITGEGKSTSESRLPLLIQFESKWVMNMLSESGTSEGTAKLIISGIEKGNPVQYLDDYETVSTASAEQYYEIAKKYFPSVPVLRFYSADAQ